MESNQGAAQARNTGLAQSFGDHAILLDDDVIPSAELISAYLGAIARYPDAAGKLPSPYYQE
jgi:glycosyltransferase involved in cell wall biosynthesis